MPSMYRLFGLAAVISSLVAATPVLEHPHLDSRDELLQLEERQDSNGDDLETDAATDPLRDAIDYTSVFSAQATATYSAVSTGASPSDAVLASVTAVSPGNAAAGTPPDPSEQGQIYNIDHILELQFVVGAFQVNPRPTTGTTSIPLDKWNSASIACFTSTRGTYPPQQSIASAFSGAFNLQGIPSRFNGFKQQVFTGRIKSNPNNPSARTYPQDFGPALQKFLSDNEQDVYGIIDDVGKALGSDAVGNDSAIQPYFTAYAQGEYRSAISFLSTWVGTSYTAAATTTTSSPTSAPKPASVPATKTTSAAPPPSSPPRK
ncbi:hypothetical protein BDR22DRAFT_135903 [Usnea florida]